MNTDYALRSLAALLLTLPLTALATGDKHDAHHGHGAHHGHDASHDAHGKHGAHYAPAVGIGVPGDAGKVTRTVEISMLDTMRFQPAQIKVKAGETVRFVVSNQGKLKHEMSLGTMQQLREHAKVMAKNPDMEHHEAGSLSLQPGGKGEIIWHFDSAGKVDFACLYPGHFSAGMKGQVRVQKAAQ